MQDSKQASRRKWHSGEAFLFAFVASLLVVSLPVKNAAYLAAPVYLVCGDHVGSSEMPAANVPDFHRIAEGVVVGTLLGCASGHQVNVPGMILSVITFLPFIVLLAERPDKWMDDRTFHQLVQVACWFLLIQSVIGVIQFILSGNPDAVCGSFGLLDFAKGTITIAQVYFTFTMFGMILLLMVARQTSLTLVAILAGLVTCALAQSGHQTIFFVASIAALGFSRVSRPSTTLATGMAAGLVFAATMVAYPQTIELTRAWYNKVVNDSRSPKRMVIEGALETLSDPKNLAIGTDWASTPAAPH